MSKVLITKKVITETATAFADAAIKDANRLIRCGHGRGVLLVGGQRLGYQAALAGCNVNALEFT